MKKRFTEHDAEEQLQKVPRLRLDPGRRNEIWQHALSQSDGDGSSQRNTSRRRAPWGPMAAGAAAVVMVGGAVAFYADGKSVSGPAQHNHDKTSASSRLNQWMTDFQKRKLAAQAVANLFHGQPPASIASSGLNVNGDVPIVSMSTVQDGAGQTVYQVKMKGKFTHNHQQAAYLSFTMSADGSKVWDVLATTNTAQTLWTVKNSLHPQFKQLVYSGGSKDWTGVYRQGSAQIWWEDSVAKQTQLGSSRTHTGMVWYTGLEPVPNVTVFRVEGDNGGSTYHLGNLTESQPKSTFLLSDLDMSSTSDPIHVSFTANGHKETFQLRDAANKGAKPLPIMKVAGIQPQEDGVLIRVQGKAQPVRVAIDSTETQGWHGTSLPQASFIIRDATLANASVANFTNFNQGGNQSIRSISVTPQGSDLLVQLHLNDAETTVNAHASGSYIGVALQNPPSDLSPVYQHTHAVGKLPNWFLNDMVLAASYEGTPMMPVTYGQMLPRKPSPTFLLAAPLDTKASPGESVTYTTYTGAIPLLGIVDGLLNGSSTVSASRVHTGYVKEVRNGKTIAVKATLLDMENAWGIGFAKDQLIVYSEHAGFYTYTVYPVPGLWYGTSN